MPFEEPPGSLFTMVGVWAGKKLSENRVVGVRAPVEGTGIPLRVLGPASPEHSLLRALL